MKASCAASSTSISTTKTYATSGKDATPAADADTLSLVPSIAGGTARRNRTLTLSKDEILRYSRHLIVPEVGMEGQLKLKAAKVLLVGTGGLGAPLGLYLAAAGIGRIGLVDFDVVDFTNLQRQVIHFTKDVGRNKIDSAAEKMHGAQSQRGDRQTRGRAHQRERPRDPEGLRPRGGRHRQFPHPLPGQRRLRAAGQAQRLRLHLPLRRPGHGLRLRGRPLLSLPLSRTAASRPGAELRRRRRARHSARHHRPDPGHRSRQADPRHRRTAGRTPAAVRRARHALPRAQAAQESRVPHLRRPPDNHQADRLPSILRRAATTPRSRRPR